MSKITAEMWEKAIGVLHSKRNRLREYGVWYDTIFYDAMEMDRLQDRYDDGERSIELYNAIMELR